MTEFDWLRNLFTQFPEPPKIRKTIFDIAGFPRWENVNSNEDLVSYSSISIYYELYGEYTKFGPIIKDKLRSAYTPPYSFSIGINGGINSDYYHLITNDHFSFADDKPLQEQIIQIFGQVFFNEQFNVVQMCTKWVEDEINSQ